jgi:calcineurin-like phosphoesterase family protein
VTADHHWSHANIIKFCDRPFESVAVMDEALIEAWNQQVPPEGTIYYIGDFCLANPRRIIAVRKRLNGTIRLIKGNHDKGIRGEVLACFEWVKDYYESKTEDGKKVVMCHYPFMTWNRSHHGAWCLHGHCHGTLQRPEDLIAKALRKAGFGDAADYLDRTFTAHPRRIDIGVDNHPNFAPFSFEEIQAIMAERQYVAVDHHGSR